MSIVLLGIVVLGALSRASAESPEVPVRDAKVVRVRSTEDFEVTGDGRHKAWGDVEWTPIPRKTRDGLPYESRFKLLYSATGLYVLFHGTDKVLTTTGRRDFDNLWEEDVFEVFLWTHESQPVYFEYEISPMAYELPILVPNLDGKYLGWRPWHYEGSRKTRKATAVTGGKKDCQAAVNGWSAEVFIPYKLLEPLKNVPPQPGTKWRANLYRMDYDNGKHTAWAWQPVETDFHDYKRFGTLVFE